MRTIQGQTRDKEGTIAGYSSIARGKSQQTACEKQIKGGEETMITTTKKLSSRSKRGAALTEFAAALSLFFICIFVPMVDIAFVPARYFLTYCNMDNVVHRMALSEKRSQALRYLHSDNSWKKAVECWGVSVKNVKASVVVCGQAGNSKVTLAEGAEVPNSLLPNAAKNPDAGCTYALEVTTTVDVPPLFSSKAGLPGFTKPIEFKFCNRAQWENLSPDPYTTNDAKSVKYYINE